MDGDTNILSQLAEMVRAFDDDAYATFANKGLLRRARKEIEKGTPAQLITTTATHVDIAVAEYTVRMPASGPAKATCTCPAPGVCWHILLACLKLEELAGHESPAAERVPSEAPPIESPQDAATVPVGNNAEAPSATEDPWLAMSEEQLRKWAGAESYRKARKLSLNELERVEPPEVFFSGGVKCRLLPSGGLGAILSNAPPKKRNAYALAAVLAYRESKGLVDTASSAGDASAVLDLETLDDIQSLLENAVEVGLNHLSLSTLQRMQRLSVRCRASALVRPSLELEGCAQEVEWIRDRHARADLPRLFDRMARLYALAESIRNQGPAATQEFLGTPRAIYASSDALDLVGMGTYPWETESGYIGLTALFWSPSQRAFFSWSDSRAKHSTAGFTPRKCLDGPSPWAGGGALQVLSRASFRLDNPKTSPERRLSAHAGCRAAGITPTISLDALPPAFTSWAALRESQNETRAIGLRRSVPLDSVVRICPAKWHKPLFDENEQRLLIPLEDSEGDALMLLLPFSDITAPAIYFLESYKPKRPAPSLICYYRLKPAEHLFPVSLLEDENALSVSDLLFKPPPTVKTTLRGLVSKAIRRFILLPQTAGAEVPDESADQNDIALFLSPIDDYLLQLAECGSATLASGIPAPKLDLSAVGFLRLSSCLSRLSNAEIPSAPHVRSNARDLLVSRYHYLLLLEAS